MPDSGSHGANPENFVAVEIDGRGDGIGAREQHAATVIGAGVDAEQHCAADVVMHTHHDTVSRTGLGLGIDDGDLAIDMQRLHGVAVDAHGKGLGVRDAEGEVLTRKAGAVQRAGEQQGIPHGNEREGGEAR